jgi:hypothetical protein
MLLAAPLLAALPLIQSDTPDLIVLNDGKEIECRVLFEGEDTVTYTKKRKAEEVPLAEVASIQSIERSLREFLEAYDRLSGDDVAGLLDLAKFCESRELLAEARNLRIRVLLIDPENDEAWTRLGGVHSERKGWRMKVRGRFYSLEDLRERVSDWKNAMEMPTAHFLIKSDVAPERVLDLSIDIERAYLSFYELLGDVLNLYPFDEIPEIYVYSDEKDYGSPPNPGQVAWFAPVTNVLHVNASAAESAPTAAVAELTEVLLSNAFHRTVGKTGTVEEWARKGLSLAFGGAYRRDPGHASWDLSTPIQEYFRTHARAEEPLSLKDVIRAGRFSYDSGDKAHLYTAQSYTLCHFLAHGEDGALRAKFGEYLLSSFRGKGSSSHFEKITGADLEELEARWTAYVRSVAGA